MNPTSQFPQFAIYGGAIAIITALWSQVRGAILGAWGVLVVHNTLDEEVHKAMVSYLNGNAKRISLTGRFYTGFSEFVNRTGRRQTVAAERMDQGTGTFYILERTLIYLQGSEISFLRGTINEDKLIHDAVLHFNAIKAQRPDKGLSSRFRVLRRHGKGSVHARSPKAFPRQSSEHYETPPTAGQLHGSHPQFFDHLEAAMQGRIRLVTDQLQNLGGVSQEAAPILETLSYPDSVAQAIQEVELWLKSEHWFRQRGVPWRRGWLLTGQPGTGKTTLCVGIAQKFDLPVWSFDCSSMSNEEFEENWSFAAENAPVIVLIEDLDRVFHGDENIAGEMGGGLTLDCVLNNISGAKPSDGVFTIITCNDETKVASAIAGKDENGKVSRPGRVDRILNLVPLDEIARTARAQRILDFLPAERQAEVIKQGEGETAAQFTDRCVTIALDHFWKNPVVSHE